MGEGIATGRDPDFKSEEGGDLEEVTAGAGLAWGLLGERPGASWPSGTFCFRSLPWPGLLLFLHTLPRTTLKSNTGA